MTLRFHRAGLENAWMKRKSVLFFFQFGRGREWVNPAIDSDALANQITMAGLEVDG